MWSNKVVGQNKIKNSFHESIAKDTLSHALIIDGASGYGGLPIALGIAQELLCVNNDHSGACGKCKSCQQVENLIHPDLHIAFPVVKKEGIERKNTTSKDFMPEWRSLVLKNPYITYNEWIRNIARTTANGDINVKECTDIIQQLNMQSFSGSKKIQILWIADQLGSNGNKLLKLIEEPPEGTHIILICEDLDKLLQTIISRCQVIRLPRIEGAMISEALSQTTNISADAAKQISFLSDGDFSLALSYTYIEQNDLLEICLKWIRLCFSADFYSLRNWASEFSSFNIEEQKAILNYFLKLLESQLHGKVLGHEAIRLTDDDKLKFIQADSFHELSLIQIEKIASIVNAMITKIERFVSGRMVMFDGSLQIAQAMSKKYQNKHTVSTSR